MNRTKLKNYAPKARRDFIEAVIHRASIVGIFPDRIAPVEEKGDVVIICGNPFPKQVAHQRSQLEKKVKERGFDQVMEAMAYTWFNRIVALRYMELHGYLDHGYRVLSHPQGKPTPEILEHAEHVSLPGLDSQNIINLKLDGIREADLYRMVLVAQCNALHDAMPFLFERIDDGKELLLPDNLLHSDSLIRKMVEEIDEADWKEVEIIGWLYQFYISEKKDKVIGKVVASDDIPAATQLFTPNWIVKYLVQNTLGRQWLATYPESVLRQKMEYYIEPAQQTPEVQKQLSTITPTSLNPEELTFLDPACGSGHILVEAYDLFKAVYQERGYQAKDIPTLILQKNLFGLEIDDRAAQLAAFALMMKARADDRRIFDKATKPNVAAIRGSNGLNAADLAHALNSRISKETSVETDFVSQADIASLLELFKDAKTFGSLIQIPSKLMAKLPEIENRLHDVLKFGDLTQASAHVLRPLLQQARLLAVHYDAVVANPPYMGSKYYTPTLKTFVNREYQTAKADLYACFMERNRVFCKPGGFNGMINIPNWMFLSSFEELRKELFASQTIDTFVHNGRGVFGSDFGSCAFVIRNKSIPLFKATYRRLFEDSSSVSSNEEIAERYFSKQSYLMDANSLRKIPGAPLAYWLSAALADLFAKCPSAESLADARQGLATGGNDLFMRYWHEVNVNGIGFGVNSREDARTSRLRWFVCNKGGPFRRWYGNLERVVDWQNDGQRVKAHTDKDGSVLSRPQNQDVYFREGITWSDVTISYSSFRL
ncbi:MAG: BREX-1 system adenine-specific DNA-methyltransferase PglX, partial [Limisphaerales bacterium]